MENFISSNELDEDQLEEMFEKVDSGQVIEIDGCFNDQCYIEVIQKPLDPSRAKVETRTRVEKVKRIIELSEGRKNEKYREF